MLRLREVLDRPPRIQSQAKEQASHTHPEYLCREQLKAIRKKLGESADTVPEAEDLRKKIEEAQMPAEARKECDRELKRLQPFVDDVNDLEDEIRALSDAEIRDRFTALRAEGREAAEPEVDGGVELHGLWYPDERRYGQSTCAT